MRALLMFMPLLLVVVIPVVYAVAVSLMPVQPVELPAAIPEGTEPRVAWLSVFTTYLCPLLFLSVPIICSVASAACAFVSERESGTLETLMLTTMSYKSVFSSKVTVCTLISVIISLISFVAFTITMSIADLLLSAPYFFSLEWLAMLLLLTPSLALFSTIFVSLITTRVRTVSETLQTMGYLILPFALLYIAQLTGVVTVNFLFIVLCAIILIALSIILFNASARRFSPEIMFAENSHE